MREGPPAGSAGRPHPLDILADLLAITVGMAVIDAARAHRQEQPIASVIRAFGGEFRKPGPLADAMASGHPSALPAEHVPASCVEVVANACGALAGVIVAGAATAEGDPVLCVFPPGHPGNHLGVVHW